ncbi:MAG: cytochrome B [Aquabacterium sp.]|uniref:cytochrome b/b6 domain-containing protein n=1 Tax=Aquabacterium sp. TaxID=1872578 RepID=UPI001226EDB5|nr:cytochrome b/b6 domain-containing protein [Aquabacterium sp.]TAK91315.1 MAG: cytochrome B [Aquabacterium sp.]
MALQEAAVIDVAGNDVPDIAQPASSTIRVQLWDLPLRLFHWSLVAAVTTAIITGKAGGTWIELHAKAGIAIVGLVVFRLVWGLIGSTSARFHHFAPTPGKILAYLQGRWRGIGHNPLGALSVFALLGLLGFQAGSGLLSNDDISFAGPLAQLIGDDLSHTVTNWHHQAANLLFVLLGLHIAAIAFYARVKKDKLVKPMVTGWKDVPADAPQPRRARRIALIAALALALGAIYGTSGAWIKKDAPPPATSPDTSTSASTKPTQGNAPAW